MARTKVKKELAKKLIAATRKKAIGKKSAVKGELKYIPWNGVELEDLNPLLRPDPRLTTWFSTRGSLNFLSR